MRRSISWATACETSSHRLVSGLNITTRSGSLLPAHQVADGGLKISPALSSTTLSVRDVIENASRQFKHVEARDPPTNLPAPYPARCE
jgi:hypothetical protein